MHPLDSVRNISRGQKIFFSGSYFDLSPNEDECYLVCKSFNGTAGTIRVYDPTNITEVEVSSMNASVNSGGISTTASGHSGGVKKKIRRRCHLHTTIDAHEHPVTRMLIGNGSSSSFVATASSKGTTIRVFGLPHGHQLYEWHRGSRSCQILSLSWNGLGDRLVSHGSSNTIHVFEWNNLQHKKKGELTGLEHSHADARDFEEVRENINAIDTTNNDAGAGLESISEKPLFKRIGATIRRHTVGSSAPTAPLKHRSFAKMKYHSTGSRDQQQLVIAMLDRHDSNVISASKNSLSSREDTVVMCSSNGELRQYAVKLDGPTKLVQLEDVLISSAK
jgi:WD40 repeat protein